MTPNISEHEFLYNNLVQAGLSWIISGDNVTQRGIISNGILPVTTLPSFRHDTNASYIWQKASHSNILATIYVWVSAFPMCFGTTISFVPQYLDITRTGNAEGFSLKVCLVLLIASTLRILFWFGHPFEWVYLASSINTQVVMLVLIYTCVNTRRKTSIVVKQEKSVFDFQLHDFWNWTDFQSYFCCTLLFTALVGILLYSFINVTLFVEFIGFMAVFSEAMLGIPQIYHNYKNQSTEGMSLSMVGMWMFGDSYKTLYFVLRDAPTQFWACGTIQVSLEIVIIFQTWLYRKVSVIYV